MYSYNQHPEVALKELGYVVIRLYKKAKLYGQPYRHGLFCKGGLNVKMMLRLVLGCGTSMPS